MTSIVFPGQGSQTVGMAKDFYDNFKIARIIFEEIEEYTRLDLRKIIFENEENKLNLTQFTQISIFTASYVIFKTLSFEKDLDSKNINIMLGHSLGEYTALACSDKISLKDCSLILKKRGELMNSAVTPNATGMAALIGLPANSVQEIIDSNNLKLEIANDNSEIQIVISGKIEDLKNSKEIFLNNDIKKFVLLNVSAAFHSNYMNDAQKKLAEEINKLKFKENSIKIISNYDAKIYNNNILIKKNLQNQMANKVNWTQSIKKLEETGENKIIEIGPGKVLSGLIKRISNNFDIKSINQVLDLK
tara:strand:- start:106 stop:1017 length:912 start_codon:yes stop_codon:yes gene_type:complete